MNVRSPVPFASLTQLMQALQPVFPQYKFHIMGKSVIVGKSGAAGIHITPSSQTDFNMGWAIPNRGVQVLLNLGFVAGILPGLVGYLIAWAVAAGAVGKLKSQFKAFLESGGQNIIDGVQPGSQVPGQPVVIPRSKPLIDFDAMAKKLEPRHALLIAAAIAVLIGLGQVSVSYDAFGSVLRSRESAENYRTKAPTLTGKDKADYLRYASQSEDDSIDYLVKGILRGVFALVLFGAAAGGGVGFAVWSKKLKAKAAAKAASAAQGQPQVPAQPQSMQSPQAMQQQPMPQQPVQYAQQPQQPVQYAQQPQQPMQYAQQPQQPMQYAQQPQQPMQYAQQPQQPHHPAYAPPQPSQPGVQPAYAMPVSQPQSAPYAQPSHPVAAPPNGQPYPYQQQARPVARN